ARGTSLRAGDRAALRLRTSACRRSTSRSRPQRGASATRGALGRASPRSRRTRARRGPSRDRDPAARRWGRARPTVARGQQPRALHRAEPRRSRLRRARARETRHRLLRAPRMPRTRRCRRPSQRRALIVGIEQGRGMPLLLEDVLDEDEDAYAPLALDVATARAGLGTDAAAGPLEAFEALALPADRDRAFAVGSHGDRRPTRTEQERRLPSAGAREHELALER